MLKITFLGTGTSQGIPVIGSKHPVCQSSDSKDKRLRVSVLIQWDNLNLVIDCGPDFRQQMLREKVTHLDGIFLLTNMPTIVPVWMTLDHFFLDKVISQYLQVGE